MQSEMRAEDNLQQNQSLNQRLSAEVEELQVNEQNVMQQAAIERQQAMNEIARLQTMFHPEMLAKENQGNQQYVAFHQFQGDIERLNQENARLQADKELAHAEAEAERVVQARKMADLEAQVALLLNQANKEKSAPASAEDAGSDPKRVGSFPYLAAAPPPPKPFAPEPKPTLIFPQERRPLSPRRSKTADGDVKQAAKVGVNIKEADDLTFQALPHVTFVRGGCNSRKT